jgi:dTDP-4-amino-4,6-dideoxygalactose transaminase
MLNPIPVMKPLLPSVESLVPYLQSIDDTRIYSNFGPLNQALSSRLADYFNVDVDNVLLVSNGTLALQASVATSSVSNAHWTIPSWTFVATAQAVVSAGCRISFEDVKEDTWGLTGSNHRVTDGVIGVIPFGGSTKLSEWIVESARHPVILDAASCFDSCRDLSLVNKHDISVMVSLHATKLVTTGEGGVLIGPKAWIAEAKRWINFGFFGDRIARRTGTNAKLSELQAAVGLASLDQWGASRESWSTRVQSLGLGLREFNVRVQPAVEEGFVTSTLVALFASSDEKIAAIAKLTKAKIESREWWGAGVHNMPAFKSSAEYYSLPITESLADRTVGLPLYVDMTDEDIERVLTALSS